MLLLLVHSRTALLRLLVMTVEACVRALRKVCVCNHCQQRRQLTRNWWASVGLLLLLLLLLAGMGLQARATAGTT